MSTDRFLPPDTALREPVTQQALLDRIEKLTRERDALKARLDVYVTGVDYHMARCPSFRQTCSAAFAPSALSDTAGPERGEGEGA